jgi:hypothetical protein
MVTMSSEPKPSLRRIVLIGLAIICALCIVVAVLLIFVITDAILGRIYATVGILIVLCGFVGGFFAFGQQVVRARPPHGDGSDYR